MRNLRFFLWVSVPILAFLAFQLYGLPHFRWSYSWRNDGQGYNPFASRYYTSCTYIGPYETFTIRPSNGQCDWVIFSKSDGGTS